MIALVTGASSGIGRDMAIELAQRGYDVIAAARSTDKLQSLKEEIEENNSTKVYVKTVDVSKREECIQLYEDVKNEFKDIDILINNAGFGLCGKFTETDLDKELTMIDTNITGLHILTKLFLKDMVKRDYGYIMNVASIAGFMPGPLMSTYYASKSYVIRFTEALMIELRKQHSKVKLSVLCPGPVDTNFNNVANVRFSLKGQSSKKTASKAIKKMLKNKFMIFTSFPVHLGKNAARLMPELMMGRICYNIQKGKIEK